MRIDTMSAISRVAALLAIGAFLFAVACTESSSSRTDPNGSNNVSTDGGLSDGGAIGDGGSGSDGGQAAGSYTDCIADNIAKSGKLPSTPLCKCACKPGDCDCLEVTCNCDVQCYGQGAVGNPDCIFECDAQGNCKGPAELNCKSEACAPYSDTSEVQACNGVECQWQPDVVAVNPQVQPSPQVDVLERQVKRTGNLFLMDPSGSSKDDQNRYACAANKFVEEAGKNGGQFSAGVTSMDLNGVYTKDGMPTGSDPSLMGFDPGSCSAPPTCTSCGDSSQGSGCAFNDSGKIITDADPDAGNIIRLLLPIAQYRESWHDEAGPLRAFAQLIADWKAGNKTTGLNWINVTDEDADGDAEGPKTTAYYGSAAGIAELKAIFGDSWNPPLYNGGDKNAYYVEFFCYVAGFFNVKIHALSNPGDNKLYVQLATCSGGEIGNLLDCNDHARFMAAVGKASNTLSTNNLCLKEAPKDPSTMVVTHNGNPVPQSASDGWSVDPGDPKCLVISGPTWGNVQGQFQVSYGGGSGGPATACLPAGTNVVKKTISVTQNGQAVDPKCYSLDPNKPCLILNTTVAGCETIADSPLDIHYL